MEENAKKLIKNPDLQLNLRGKIHDGALYADQGTIAGCSGGTYSNIMEAAYLLENKSTGNDAFNLSVYPSSQAVMMDLLKKGAIETLAAAGATIRTAFCGPCVWCGRYTAHGQFAGSDIRARNFPNRGGI